MTDSSDGNGSDFYRGDGHAGGAKGDNGGGGDGGWHIARTINTAHPHYISSPMNMNTLSKLH